MDKPKLGNEHENVAIVGTGEAGDAGNVGLWRGLSGKLLGLTILFVMVAEVLIFLPSVANFRNIWLKNHLEIAEAASLVYLDSSDHMLSMEVQQGLLAVTNSIAIVVRRGETNLMMASAKMPAKVRHHIDLSYFDPLDAIVSALSIMAFGGDQHLRVFAPMMTRDAWIELVQEERYLRDAMFVYSRNVFLLSMAISLITAFLVFAALYWLLVRPLRKISSNLTAFSQNPENASLVIQPSQRVDEIGDAEHRLSRFQTDVQATLRQKQRLADLGLAVAKINHDLRNILASAQLLSDRLTMVDDPTVQRFAPKLIHTIDRAAGYTRSVIDYGKTNEAPPNRRMHALRGIVDDVGDLLGLPNDSLIEWHNRVPDNLEANVDADQLFRVLMNLCRNARQALEEDDANANRVRRISVEGKRDASSITLAITDTGPGMPAQVRESLFKAFAGSARPGGTGLGLAIAAELVRAHGGDIEVKHTSTAGTRFEIHIPDPLPQPENGR